MTSPRRVPVSWTWWSSIAALGSITALTRWPFRSRFLFSWDSANYALAMARIDIAAHRPHPPGYLAYVIAGRLLDRVFHDPNAALVAWNVFATALLVVAIVWFVAVSDEGGADRRRLIIGAAAITLTSPLLWFYSEVAEIYPSETLVTFGLAVLAIRAPLNWRRAAVTGAVAFAAAAFFKLSAALLMLPVIAVSWTRAPAPARTRALVWLAGTILAVAAVFVLVQPNILDALWIHFTGATVGNRLIGGETAPLKAINRNTRDVAVASVAALGVVNAVALIVWAIVDRRLPAILNRRTVLTWLFPWLAVFVVIHIGKPGYVLPLLPIAVLVLASWYARLKPALGYALIGLQALVNVAQFVGVVPDVHTAASDEKYGQKSRLERAASDLRGLLFPTLATIRRSDHAVADVQALVIRTCPTANPVIVSEMEPVDWRRLMWYFPRATAVYRIGDSIETTGHLTEATSIPPEGVHVTTSCAVIWLSTPSAPRTTLQPGETTPEPGLGVLAPGGSLLITTSGIAVAAGR